MKKNLLIALVLLLCVLMVGCKTKEEKAAMQNPWVETDAAGMAEIAHMSLAEPEGAENIQYRGLKSESLGEMRFTLNGVEINARIKPTAEFEDISGMNYKWESEEAVKVSWCEGKLLQAKDGDKTVEAVLFFDFVPGISYSLSCSASDLSGFDLVAVAEQVFIPAQGDA